MRRMLSALPQQASQVMVAPTVAQKDLDLGGPAAGDSMSLALSVPDVGVSVSSSPPGGEISAAILGEPSLMDDFYILHYPAKALMHVSEHELLTK